MSQDVADDIEQSIRLGSSAAAYWQFVSAKQTHTLDVNGVAMAFHKQPDGWAAYPEGFTPPVPKADGSLPRYAVCDTLEEFRVYQQQVERGEFWGAAITQFGGVRFVTVGCMLTTILLGSLRHAIFCLLYPSCRPQNLS